MPHPPLHITYVAPFGLGQKTTVWARTLPLARQMVQLGHSASILIPPWDTPQDAGKQWVDDGVQIIHTTLGGGLPAVLVRLLHLLHQQQPHIIHIIKPRAHAGLVQWWLWQKRLLGDWVIGKRRFANHPITQSPNPPIPQSPKLILDLDDWEQAWATINPYPWPVARFLAWQEEWGIRHADAITAASRWLVARAQAYTPQTPVLYLPNGVEVHSPQSTVHSQQPAASSQQTEPTAPPIIDNSQLTIDNSQFSVLFFTRFVEVDPQWLVDFWQALHAQLPSARLLVAGDALQPGRAAIFQQQLQSQLPRAATQVEWLGYVPPAQLEQLYPTVACAIFPAQNIPLLQAKCSVKLATTLLHGVPVVASAVGEQAAYGAEGSALLVDPAATPAQFADAVKGVLQQPAVGRALVEQARCHLQERYRWEKLAGELADFYQVTLQRS